MKEYILVKEENLVYIILEDLGQFRFLHELYICYKIPKMSEEEIENIKYYIRYIPESLIRNILY